MKLLILVLAKDSSPWKEIENSGQNRTWRNVQHPSVQILRYVGQERKLTFQENVTKFLWKLNYILDRQSRIRGLRPLGRLAKYLDRTIGEVKVQVTQHGNTLNVHYPDQYHLIGAKTIAAFEYCLRHLEFDYLYRTNISSYVDIEKLLGFCSNLKSSKVYAGAFGTYFGIPFASGSGYLLSRTSCQELLERRHYWRHSLVDDVAVGEIVSTLPTVTNITIPRLDLRSRKQVQLMPYSELLSSFHYRCKHEDSQITIDLMNEIQARLDQNK